MHRYLSNLRRYLTNAQVRQLLGAINLRSPFGQRDLLLQAAGAAPDLSPPLPLFMPPMAVMLNSLASISASLPC